MTLSSWILPAQLSRLGKTRKELNYLREAEKDALRRTDLLAFQANEIEAAHLVPGEEEELTEERSRLANAESLASLARAGAGGAGRIHAEVASISDLSGQAVQALNSLARIDRARWTGGAGTLPHRYRLRTGRDLRDYLEEIESNPRRLEAGGGTPGPAAHPEA